MKHNFWSTILLVALWGTVSVAAEGFETSFQDTTLAKQYFDKAEGLAASAKYDSAIFFFEKASLNYEKAAARENEKTMWEKYVLCYNRIGKYLLFQQKYSDMIKYLNQALKIGESKLGENHPDIGYSYNILGAAYFSREEYEAAHECYQKSIAIWRQTYGENHAFTGKPYYNIGSLYLALGEYDFALNYFHKALVSWREALGENTDFVASAYNAIGNTYNRKGDINSAIEFYNKALSAAKELYGENDPEVANGSAQMGRMLFANGDYNKAMTYYDQAAAIWKNKFGESAPFLAAIYDNIGDVYNNGESYASAIDYYQRALTLKQKKLGEHHSSVAHSYHKLGNLYQKQNNFERGLYYFQQSILTLVAGFSESNIYLNPPLHSLNPDLELLSSLALKADALKELFEIKSHDLRDIRAAVSTYQLAMNLIDKIRSGYKADRAKLSLGENTSNIYDNAIQASLKIYDITQNEQYRHLSFSFAEKGKASVLSQALRDLRATHFGNIPTNLLIKEKELRLGLIACDTELQKAREKLDKQDSLIVRSLENRHFALTQEYNDLIDQFEISYPQYFELKHKTQTATVRELQSALDEETALIEYFVGNNKIYIFAVTSKGFEAIVQEKEPTLDSLAISLISSFKNISSKTTYLKISAHLYDILIEPVEHVIGNKQRWVIIPDGTLYQIPFEALLRANVSLNALSDYAELPYVLKRHEILYHYSATLFLRSMQELPNDGDKGFFVGFAPVFSEYAQNGHLLPTDFSTFTIARPDATSFLITRDGKTLEELKYTVEELQGIFSLFHFRGRTYLHSEATEENFKKNIKDYKYIHVATHGFINSENPKLSNLAFSQPQSSNVKEDGILYSGETYNLDLNADLLVLSACQTGAGKIVKGEGLMALTRGFFYSGARNIVASLWKVYDQHTSLLMVEMYRQIAAGKSYSAALREAKLKMIANPETAGPQSWAGFVLFGR